VARDTAKWCGDRTQSTVWEIDHVHPTHGTVDDGETIHGTQKPVECMARPIRNHGGKDDDVYDPFLGSGTTLIAAEQLGRRCFGLEVSPAYCDVIVQRWQKLTGKHATLEETGDTLEAMKVKRGIA
jgi:DNA modification methylase